MDRSQQQTAAPAASPDPAPPEKGAPAPAPADLKRRRKKPSPVPVSMWLLPRLRLPFSSPMGFLRWFITGINFWAVGAAALCALAGWALADKLSQPRQLGVEQALSGGAETRGLAYAVARTGEGKVTVTGSWDPEKDPEPGPELAAALCAALSPEEIYGHSDHLYRSIADTFFEGGDFGLTICLRRAGTDEDGEEPEPLFTITRPAGAADWPQPDCAAAFAEKWRETYDGYWLFGQGRKEEMGPPKADPIFEEGDRPPEPSESGEEEAPPLPDLDAIGGIDGPGDGEVDGDGEESEVPDSLPTEESSASDHGGSSGDGADAGGEDTQPSGDWLDKLVAYAARYRGLGWKEAWELFFHGEK